MSKLIICKACGKEIVKGAKCLSCGNDQRNFFMKHKIITVIWVLVILGGIGFTMDGGFNSVSKVSPSSGTRFQGLGN